MYILVATWLSAGTLSFDFEPFSWWGTGWGPRYLVCVLPFITIMLGSILSHIGKRTHIGKKTLPLIISFIVLSVAGFCISLLGVLIWWQYDIVYVSENEQLWNQDPWNQIVWNPSYWPILLHAKMILTDYLSQINPQNYADTSWNWINYGFAPCSFDLYIFCNFGMIPVILILAVITVLGYYIGIQIQIFGSNSKKFVLKIASLKDKYNNI
jgi:hypothetical protein